MRPFGSPTGGSPRWTPCSTGWRGFGSRAGARSRKTTVILWCPPPPPTRPGERAPAEDIRDLVVAYAARHDAELADRVQRINPDDLNAVHDAVFEAQGRVMLELAQLRRVPNWQDLDLTLAPGDDEAA